jgi:Arc/MetJ-type ribon-helix-helix transcriptional regulator
MQFSLSKDTEQLIEARMRQWGYGSADDLIRAAIDALDQVDDSPDEDTLDAIDRAEDQVERGEYFPWADVKANLRANRPTTGKP